MSVDGPAEKAIIASNGVAFVMFTHDVTKCKKRSKAKNVALR